MARVIFTSDLQRHTNGLREVEIAAFNYRELTRELCQRFPALTEAIMSKYAIAIDGVIIQTPLLEKITSDSEIVFVAKIAGG